MATVRGAPARVATTLCIGLLMLVLPGQAARYTSSQVAFVDCASDPANPACQANSNPAMAGRQFRRSLSAAPTQAAALSPKPAATAGSRPAPASKTSGSGLTAPSPKPGSAPLSAKPAGAGPSPELAAASPSPKTAAATPSPKPANTASGPRPGTTSPSPRPATASPSPKPATAAPSLKPTTASPSPKLPAAASLSPMPAAASSPSPKPAAAAAAAAAASPNPKPAGGAAAAAGPNFNPPGAVPPAAVPATPTGPLPVPLPVPPPLTSPVPLPVTSSGSPAPAPAPVNASPTATPNSAMLFTAVDPSVYTQVETWVDTGNITIPTSFMGLSHEWGYVEDLDDIPEYPKVIQTLTAYGRGPMIIRVGGGSTDFQTTVPGNDVWSSLAALYKSAGTRYILGLNFYNGDVGLARRQMQAALNGLPADAIVGFEIGNEPNFYVNKSGTNGSDYVRCCFVNDWKTFAAQMSCPQGANSCVDGQFIGPVWGHVNMYPNTMDWFLSKAARWVKFTSIHWYKATAQLNNTAATLLEEDPIRKEADNLAKLVRVSNSYGRPLRVAEMNTISNGGRYNVSNVFASALWTLDLSFEVAQAGGVGVNFHQGPSKGPYAAILRWDIKGQYQPPILRPAFYGMLMFNMAVRGNSRIMNRAVNPYNGTSADAASMVKIWPLQDNETGELRWVIINKHDRKGSRVRVRINRQSGYSNQASVTRLVARGAYPLTATSGITLGGQVYGNGAAITGSQALETLGVVLQEGMLQLEVDMPPGSAALVRLPRASAV